MKDAERRVFNFLTQRRRDAEAQRYSLGINPQAKS